MRNRDMGEVVVTCEEAVDVVVVEERESEGNRGNSQGLSSMARWDKLLPAAAIRVLLVEADDSTRQIIAALLRKCGYKVASVADGLKAWEVLKARHDSIHLILAEVELPSISGFALLSLIREHEICKNIPVIMMSTHDSVNMVYKCMLRGAADFLMKPIRINELKNLWQHVWRRQSMNREELGPQGESFTQEKLEATAENTATSDRSSSSKTCAPPRQEQCNKKRSIQSCCQKPDLEAESTYYAEVEDHLRTNTADCIHSDALERDGMEEERIHRENLNLYPEVSGSRENLPDSPREAIDLIGAFDNHSRRNLCSNGGTNKFDSSPHLDLSLRRFHPGAPENKTTDDKQMLNHSNVSAFSRYVNKTMYTSNSKANSGDIPDSNANAKEAESHSLQRLFAIPFPARGVRVEVCASPSEFVPTISPRVSSPSSSHSPCSGNQQMKYFHQFNVEVINGRPHYHPLEQSPRMSSNQQSSKQEQRLECSEGQTRFSSASSTLCNGTAVQHVNECQIVGGSNANDAVVPRASDSGNEPLSHQRSIQREAALTKFRLKRKERCFAKKVRYESRKKLAEQRPRVKGQFVRQVPHDPSPAKLLTIPGANSVSH